MSFTPQLFICHLKCIIAPNEIEQSHCLRDSNISHAERSWNFKKMQLNTWIKDIFVFPNPKTDVLLTLPTFPENPSDSAPHPHIFVLPLCTQKIFFYKMFIICFFFQFWRNIIYFVSFIFFRKT